VLPPRDTSPGARQCEVAPPWDNNGAAPLAIAAPVEEYANLVALQVSESRQRADYAAPLLSTSADRHDRE